ncbi:transforming growth factor-beta-induced protein ig-h3-like isoform X2 [Periplaneta americana]|uniref:transforming growth factor-beta-induced protein ig-h3-like isoform X2 n=1 Tax=Periplaneta americana TaxID=6978 RepID=UPI0037E8D672
MRSVFLLLALATLITHHSCIVKHHNKSAAYWDGLAKFQGPNVCAYEEIPKQDLSYSKAWIGGSLCGVRTVVKFQCCEGYGMVPGEKGCPLVKPQTSLEEMADMLDSGAFLELQETAGLSQWLANTNQGAITILAPSNKALKLLPRGTVTDLEYRVRRVPNFLESPPLLLHHTLESRVRLKYLPTDSLVPSLYSGRQIRFNVFSNELITANCIPILRTDIHTSQGLLHVLEAPLDTSPLYTLADLIAHQPQLRRLATFITQAQFGSTLRAAGSFTFFAPTDGAFREITEDRLQVLLYNEQALNALLNHHFVQDVHCYATLHNATLHTKANTVLHSRCKTKGTMVSGANITTANLMASNGVLHLIDRVLIPRRARSLMELLTDLGLTKLRSLLPTAGLQSAFKGRGTITVFAPSNRALEALGNSSVLNSQMEIRTLLAGHITSGRHLTHSLLDDQELQSLSHNKFLRMKLYGWAMVNDAVIVRPNIEGSNGVIHVINKVLVPPKFSIVTYLQSKGIYSRFLDALNRTSPSLIELLESDKAPFTVFAVTDAAIDRWEADLFAYDRMMADTRIVNSIMRNHVLPDTLFTSGLVPGNYYQVTSVNSEPLLVRRWRGKRSSVYAGIALVEKPDILCTNGVIHVVNRLIQLANPSYS